MEREFAPVLDPEWARHYGALERAVADYVNLEHDDCACPVCQGLAGMRAFRVACAWMLLEEGAQDRWLEAYGMTEQGAVMRDALADIGTRRLAQVVANIRSRPSG